MIPISTDAPIYHYPIATVSVIVINVLMFFAFCTAPAPTALKIRTPDGQVIETEEFERVFEKFENNEQAKQFIESLTEQVENSKSWMQTLSVEFGTIKPWQWLTNNFMHADFMHLLGNMIFLWAFGLIVEGKLGPVMFSIIYLSIGVFYGFMLQSCSLVFGWQGIALGASAAIFGLLALCIAWAPANEFTLLWRFGTMEVNVLLYGMFFVGQEVLFLTVKGFRMSSELLHILGFAVGLPVGLFMVRNGYVDCEGWDLFSYLNGTTGKDSTVGREKVRAREKKAAAKLYEENRKAKLVSTPQEQGEQLLAQVEQAIDRGEFELAIKLQSRIAASNRTVGWKQTDLFKLIQGLLKAKNYPRAVPLMETYIESFEQNRFPMQVSLIKIWLQDQRPRKSLEYMQGLNLAFLSTEQTQQLQQLAAYAKKQIAAGVVEVR